MCLLPLLLYFKKFVFNDDIVDFSFDIVGVFGRKVERKRVADEVCVEGMGQFFVGEVFYKGEQKQKRL